MGRGEPEGVRAERELDAIIGRIRLVAGERSYRSIGRDTCTCAETVRRYMNGARPSVQFVARFCQAYDVSADWLLFGTGGRDGAPRAGARRAR